MRGMLGHLSKGTQFLFLLLLCIFSLSVFAIMAAAAMKFIFQVGDVFDMEQLAETNNSRIISALKFSQLLNSVGLFIVPPVLFSFLVSSNSSEYLGFCKKNKTSNYFLVFLIMLVSLPFLNWMIEWNESIQLPESLSALEEMMKESEKKATELTKMLLKAHTMGDLLFNLALIAIIPALGEELLFRGVVQKLFSEIFKNPHAAIITTAILFSFLHFQFYGFFPRTFFGILFGYMLVWSGSIKLPILAHLVNNSMVVLANFYGNDNGLSQTLDNIGKSESVWWAIASVALLSVLMIVLYKNTFQKERI
ncbi:MAG: CPBP family intramembrane metalloprotease [Flavobacteriales bacterium]|nr:CPBP family intramembrane metalloprotease [Flavobacteriales bacterium]